MTIVEVFLILLIISASALCIYLIITLKKIIQEAEAIRKDVHNLVEKTLPVLDSLNEVSQRANKVVSEVEGYWDEIDNSIKNLKRKVSDFTSFKTFHDEDNPANNLIKNLRAFFKGLYTFWQTFKRN